MKTCVRCETEATGRAARRFAHGLCNKCQKREAYGYVRQVRSRDEVLDEYVFMREGGMSKRDIASQLGMAWRSFQRAMQRAFNDNDPRAADWRVTA